MLVAAEAGPPRRRPVRAMGCLARVTMDYNVTRFGGGLCERQQLDVWPRLTSLGNSRYRKPITILPITT